MIERILNNYCRIIGLLSTPTRPTRQKEWNIRIGTRGKIIATDTYDKDDSRYEFLILPTSSNSDMAFIISAHTGGVLTVTSRNFVHAKNDYPDGSVNQIFHVHVDDSYKFLLTHRPGHVALAWPAVINIGPLVMVSDSCKAPKCSPNFEIRTRQLFPFPMPTAMRGAPPGNIGDIPRITDFHSALPQESNPVLIGVVLVPFIFVRDDTGRTYQVRHTPYYTIVREQYWKMIRLDEKPASESVMETYHITHGVSAAESIKIEKMLSLVMKADGSIKLKTKLFELGLGADIERHLQVTTIYEANLTITDSQEETMNVTLPPGRRVRWAVWHLTDRYVLRRMDGTRAYSWEIVYPHVRVRDEYAE